MANFSLGDGNYTSEMNQTSTEPWPACVLVFLSALNIFLSITAILGNGLILAALRIHKGSSLHPPTKLLFRCLAVTDLCAGLFSQPLFAVAVMARIVKINYLDEVDDGCIATAFILCGISVLTLTAISVDRLLVLLLGLRYRHVVTLRRTRAVIVCFFVISVLCGSMHLWNSLITWVAVTVLLVFCLVTATFSYTKIYFTLRQHQSKVQNHVSQDRPNVERTPPNIARYKKTIFSIAWIQLALVACYAPYVIVSSVRLNFMLHGRLIFVFYLATVTLVYFNSSLNPILYYWKIKEVRQAVKETIRQFCLLCS